jgi:acetyltransferase-like isoleucine patch superfamily enzyme
VSLVTKKLSLIFSRLTFRELIIRTCDEYVWWLFKNLPGFSGLYLRYLYVKCFAKKVNGFVAIQRGVNILYTFGLELGKNIIINRGCIIIAEGGIKIGDNSALGTNVTLVANSHDLITAGTKDYSRRNRKAPIVIGSGSILCANVVVNGGVCIGNNVVISANTAVSVDVPNDQVVSSAKMYKYTDVMRHNWNQFSH